MKNVLIQIAVVLVCAYVFISVIFTTEFLTVKVVDHIIERMTTTENQTTYQITNKYEYNGHYYVNVQVEIDANDYIGYDIGDELEK